MKLRWTQRAKHDLVDIGRHIARDKPGAARRWVQNLRRRAQQVVEQPMVGRRVPELMREDVRELLVQRYRIVYLVEDEVLWILTIFEGHRLLPREMLEAESSAFKELL